MNANRIWKMTFVVGTLATLVLMVGVDLNAASGQKKSGSNGSSGKPSDAPKNLGPNEQYQHALSSALTSLKQAEKALLEADVKELNLSTVNPLVIQQLTVAVQAVNQAYRMTEQAKAMGPFATQANGKGPGKK